MWRLTVLTLGIVLGVAVAPAAYAEANPVDVEFTVDAPAHTTQVWIDAEGISATEITGTLAQGSGSPQPIEWNTTVGGPGTRSVAAPGKLTLSFAASADAISRKPIVAVTFADDAGAVLDASRLDLFTETDGNAAAGGSDGSSNANGGAGANGNSASSGAEGSANTKGSQGNGLARTGGTGYGLFWGIGALLLVTGGTIVAVRSSQLKRRSTLHIEEPGA